MTKIIVKALVNAPVEKVWEMFTDPKHIVQWNNAAEDWHTPSATNDLRVGGKFNNRMEAKDGSAGFDFTGVYDEVVPNSKIAYTMSDGRKVETTFESQGGKTGVTTVFDPENENPPEFQKAGWQAILDNFKKYTESQ
jgi:uncharacterized protein YndB with AHSA1/START domain